MSPETRAILAQKLAENRHQEMILRAELERFDKPYYEGSTQDIDEELKST
jgi:hypothetical protein